MDEELQGYEIDEGAVVGRLRKCVAPVNPGGIALAHPDLLKAAATLIEWQATRLAAMEAGVDAARRIIRCHETGYLSDTPMDPQIAAELHTQDLEKLNAAAALLGGEHETG